MNGLEEATQRKLLDVVLSECRAAGLPSLEEAQRIRRGAKSDHPLDRPLAAAMTTIQLWSLVKEQFGREPEPAPEQFRQICEKVVGQMRYLLRDCFLEFGKSMPHRPGGVKKKLTRAEAKRVLKLVADCVKSGNTAAQAVKMVAERFDVSPRTIQRECRERREELKKSF